MMGFRTVLGWASPGGRGGRLTTLIFHRVHAQPDPLVPGEMHAERFRKVLGWLRHWFQVLPLDEAVHRLQSGTLPPRAAAITFDDGYADNQQVALPILEEAGLSACFFIATGFLDGGRMWNDTLIESIRGARSEPWDLREVDSVFADLPPLVLDSWEARRHAVPQLVMRCKYLPMQERERVVEAVARSSGANLDQTLMMSSEQLRNLRSRGQQVGAHTVNHPILARLPSDVARVEIGAGKQALEALLDERIGLFAYPNGKPGEDYLPEHVQMVRDAGFDAAVTTSPGASGSNTDPCQIPRFTPWEQSRVRWGTRLLLNLRA